MERRFNPLVLGLLIFAFVGTAFAAVSTYDFVAHLDRQVHSIHCSIIPGAASDASGTSGCHTVMMSPWSSLFRDKLWGGLPISLLAFGVFGYLVFRSLELLIRGVGELKSEARYMTLAGALPVLMSLVYGFISFAKIGAACTNCVGIYVSSVGFFGCALGLFFTSTDDEDGAPMPTNRYLMYFVEGVVFVAVPVLVFLALRPDYGSVVNTCGELNKPEDNYGVMVSFRPESGGVSAIEVLDPLCPACKAFDERLQASGFKNRLDLKAILFPLDNTCNWMVSSALHPGACQVSEAVLCAESRAGEVVDWAFENQEELRTVAERDPAELEKKIKERFPDLSGCIGKAAVRAKLNKSLRWAVANGLQVLTPQLYIQGKKVCDEDTDLGLEFALDKMLNGTAGVAQKEESR